MIDQVLIAKFAKVKASTDMQSDYIAMGHYDIVRFRIENRNQMILSTGDRCFLPVSNNPISNPNGTSMYRFLTMINVLSWDGQVEEKVRAVLRNLSVYMDDNKPNGISCRLFRSLENCDIASLIDSDDYIGALSYIQRCFDSIKVQDVYFFTVPMLNARMLEKHMNLTEVSQAKTVPHTSFQVRAAIKSNQQVGDLLSEHKLLKGLSNVKKRIMFGADDVVIDLGGYNPESVIKYYQNVKANFEDYQSILFSAEVEIMKESYSPSSNTNRFSNERRNDRNATPYQEFQSEVKTVTEKDIPLRIALCSQMTSLLALKESGFFPSVCDTAIAALSELIREAQQKRQALTEVSSMDAESIRQGLQRFVEALNTTLQSYLYTDSLMLEFLSANAEVYGVRNKLALEYDRFISDCINVLEPEQGQGKRTTYLFKPCLSSSVSVLRIWPDEPPICIISIPTSLMLSSPKELLFMIAHEVSHYAGRDYRLCEKRNSVAERLCTMVFVEYAINYFNAQIGMDDISKSISVKEQRIAGIMRAVKMDRADCKIKAFYSAFCKDLVVKYTDIIESVEFINAFDIGITASYHYVKNLLDSYSIEYDSGRNYEANLRENIEYSKSLFKKELRKTLLDIQAFFLQLLKECIADILAANVLAINDQQYIGIMSGSKESEDDITKLFIIVRTAIVSDVLRHGEDLCEKNKKEIKEFEPSIDRDTYSKIEDKTDAIAIGFIKYFINKGRLKPMLAFLKEVLLNADRSIDHDNACKRKFDLVKDSGHSVDYSVSIM